MEMSEFRREIAAFLANKQSQIADARQMAALQIACHFDLAEAMGAGRDAQRLIVLRLERMIERERQRGMRRHWSYDLNRHIALKQALDRLRAMSDDVSNTCASPKLQQNGARRRRFKRPTKV